MRFLAAAAILVVLVATSRPAHACFCDGGGRGVLSPADASTDVPLNAIVIARWSYHVSIELRDATSNQLVALAQEERTHGTIFAVPLEPLAPNTTYTVTLLSSYGDPEVSSFSTGDSVDMTPPAFAGVTGLSLETMKWTGCSWNTCIATRDSRISRIRLEYADPPLDAVHVALQLYRPGDDIVGEFPVPARDPRLFGFEPCKDTVLSPALVPDMEYCARVVAYDVAGNVAGLGVELCEVAQACAPLAKSSDCCSPADECSSTAPPPEEECTLFPPLPPPPLPTATGCTSTASSSPLLVALLWFVRRKRKTAAASSRGRLATTRWSVAAPPRSASRGSIAHVGGRLATTRSSVAAPP